MAVRTDALEPGPLPRDARTLVCIPTYDEAENLPGLLADIEARWPRVDVLVVDDASPDGTGAIADRMARSHPRVHVLHRRGKEGLGSAYRDAFAWGLLHGFDVMVEMDADGSHAVEELGSLLVALERADVVLGTRWMPGGSTVGWPLRRRLLSVGGSRYARFMLHLPYRDITGGYRAYRSEALVRSGALTTSSEGYCFQVETALRAHRAGAVIREVPITFRERENGASKMSAGVILEAVRNVTLWELRGMILGPSEGRPMPADGSFLRRSARPVGGPATVEGADDHPEGPG